MRLFGDEFLAEQELAPRGTCDALSPILNGVHWCDDDANDKSVCSLLCQTGFHPVGALKTKCSCRSGNCAWSPSSPQTPKSPKLSFCRANPTCSAISAPQNGRVDCPLDSACVVTCDSGYEMATGLIEKTLTCQCDIDDYRCAWNKPVPVCRREFDQFWASIFRQNLWLTNYDS